MTTDVAGFLERFRAFGAAPGAETYLGLFHPDATLFDSGMPRPITVPEIPDHLAAILRIVPDFRMRPERWREREGTLFVEAGNGATLGGRPIRWRSIYCVTLRGDRVVRGRRYWDRQPLFARLSAGTPALPRVEPKPKPCEPCGRAPDTAEALIQTWVEARTTPASRSGVGLARLFREDGVLWTPGHPQPLDRDRIDAYERELARWIPGAVWRLLGWAGDASLLYLEWSVEVPGSDGGMQLGVGERLDAVRGRVLHARRYFDTLPLAARLEAAGSP